MSFIINPFVLGGGGAPTFNPATDILIDSIVADTGIFQFHYAGAGQSPGDAYLDSISSDLAIVEFHYSGAGESPSGPRTYVDAIVTDVAVIDFSYTV